jgi:hypothetical protein
VTIIMSVVTADYTMQVSDRLLTRKLTTLTTPEQVFYEPWDKAANKSVIVLGSDGLFAMGYTGPAHVAGAPTDGWIAEFVAGQELGANQIRPDIGAMQISQGTSTNRVLAVRFPELAQRVGEMDSAGKLTDRLSIDVVGLRWKDLNKLAWPAYGRIGWDADEDRNIFGMSSQRWGYENKNYARALGPKQNIAQKLLRERFRGADLSSKEGTAAVLIDILRSLPSEDPTVGRDCLVTTIQGVPPHVHIKYEPYDLTQMSVEFKSGRTVTVEAACTPWIITPDKLFAPAAMNVQVLPFSSSGFDFEVEGPESTMDDFLFVSSQPRRLFPERT